jgi:hypothetical protein
MGLEPSSGYHLPGLRLIVGLQHGEQGSGTGNIINLVMSDMAKQVGPVVSVTIGQGMYRSGERMSKAGLGSQSELEVKDYI